MLLERVNQQKRSKSESESESDDKPYIQVLVLVFKNMSLTTLTRAQIHAHTVYGVCMVSQTFLPHTPSIDAEVWVRFDCDAPPFDLIDR